MAVVLAVAAVTASRSDAAITVKVVEAVTVVLPGTTVRTGVGVGASVTITVIAPVDTDAWAGAAVTMVFMPVVVAVL